MHKLHFGNQAALSLSLSFSVSQASGGQWAKKGNRQFGPRLFSLLIGVVFLVEQAGVHLDVTYQQQAQGSGLAPLPSTQSFLEGCSRGGERMDDRRAGGKSGGSQQIV